MLNLDEYSGKIFDGKSEENWGGHGRVLGAGDGRGEVTGKNGVVLPEDSFGLYWAILD